MKRIQIFIFATLLFWLTGCSDKAGTELETYTVKSGDVVETVTATGTLESVNSVDVGTQVTGIISSLNADYNSIVKKGDLLAEIDKTTLQSELTSANANLESARTSLSYAETNYNRDLKLHAEKLISDYEFDTSKKDYLVAKAAYEKAQADRVRAAKNMSYAEIYAPMDGVVVSREVEVGQTVVASMNVANMFTIADLDNMRVVANVDEADIGSVKEGQNATFTVDAFPNDVFKGTVTQVRISPTTSSNVVTYEVLISADNPGHKLIPGLTANVTINVLEENGVMMIPVKALRFTPQEIEGLPVAEKTPEPPASAPKPKEGASAQDVPDPIIATDSDSRLVWILKNDKLVPAEIHIGADNGVEVEVKSGLKVGDKVCISYQMKNESNKKDDKKNESSPFAPTPPGGKKK